MQEATVPLLTTWQNFYVIIGSSAGALTGLMFVVITLIAGSRMRRSSEPIAAFSTPNVVHFAPRSSSPRFSARPGKPPGMPACYSASAACGE